MPSTELEIFPWNENFATGIEVIDTQHKQLVDLLNTLVRHLAFNADAPTLNNIFDELKNYTVVHFTTEEGIWHDHFKDDPWEAWHKDAHGDFIAKVLEIKQKEATLPMDDVIAEIVSFLTHWLALHIIESDKRMAKVVLALPSGISLERAKEQANEEMAGSTRVLINTVMGMYDKLANRTVELTREISRRLKAEAEMQNMQAELLRLKNEAVEANQAKSSFLANMSHEIRTPMNAILGLTNLLQKSATDKTQQERLDKVAGAATHLLGLINDILDLSKIEADSLELEEANLNIKASLDNVVSMMSDRVQEKGLELVEDIDPGLSGLSLLGDPLRIRQILVNYASNAVKFTDRGRITLRVSLDETRDDWVRLRFEVEDTGIGIPKDAQMRIFDAFEQAEVGTTRQYGGTGLGLAIAKRFAHLMGGEVGVVSQPGQGSTFWFTAVLRRGTAEQNISAPTTKAIRAGARILLVEDNDINQEVALALLEEVRLIVDIANHGGEAVEKVLHSSYDLILMDMQMPTMDGLEATRRIRAMGNATPIVAMTANAFQKDREKCTDAGMNDFISKPVDPERLYAILPKWISE